MRVDNFVAPPKKADCISAPLKLSLVLTTVAVQECETLRVVERDQRSEQIRGRDVVRIRWQLDDQLHGALPQRTGLLHQRYSLLLGSLPIAS